jgi:Mg2+ and Co2+ transporter CorA
MDKPDLIAKQEDHLEPDEKEDRKARLRATVYLLLPDELMVALAILMIPIVVIPLVVDLPTSVEGFLKAGDYAIIGIFVIEYVLKAALAQNIRKHVLNPWHLLDLFVVLVPLVDFLPMISEGLARSSPLLRLLRILRLVRVAAVGGRAVDRKVRPHAAVQQDVSLAPAMRIRVMDSDLENIHEDVSLEQVKKYVNSPSHTWVDITSVSESCFDELSNALGVPRILLESDLVEESYPRIDYFEHYSMIFARIAEPRIVQKGTKRLFVSRSGLLVLCYGQNIITISRHKASLFDQILEKAKRYYNPEEPLVISILYTILKYVLEKDKQIAATLEQEVMRLEDIPLNERPSDFLETTFHLKKEVNQLVPSLLHLKEIATVITTKRVPLEGFNEKHERLFDILMDEATYLHETAQDARENLLSLIDLYINTTSYEMNKVMRMIAVITCFGIIPAVGGLLGSNLIGNPWGLHLWEVFAGVGVIMLGMGWVFYRLGWLKG